MKTTLIKMSCSAALIFSVVVLVAQPKSDTSLSNKSGVYFTVDDYLNGKLTYPINCKKPEGDNIKTHNLFWNQTIDVIYNGKKRTLQKEDTYAYRDCDGTTYRFYSGADYIISEAKDIYIYILQTRRVPGQDYNAGNKYFFSKGPTAEIKDLTLANLLNAFVDNKKFCELLQAHFGHGENINEYDFAARSYKVNQLYQLSKTQHISSF